MLIDGWLEEAVRKPSPHFNPRPNIDDISLIVIHNISLPPNHFRDEWVEQFFTGHLDFQAHPYFITIAELRVSAHFYIRRDGVIIQFVSVFDRAWHAGVSSFQGRENCNDFSIGIELAGADSIPYTAMQYHRLSELIKNLQKKFPKIADNRIVGHCDIAPTRKTDPGSAFDWQRLFNSLKNT